MKAPTVEHLGKALDALTMAVNARRMPAAQAISAAAVVGAATASKSAVARNLTALLAENTAPLTGARMSEIFAEASRGD